MKSNRFARRTRGPCRVLVAALLIVFCGSVRSGRAATGLPPGFQDVPVVSGLTNPTAMAIVYGWGSANDIAVPGDYDRDGKTDLAVYRSSTGTWFILQSSSNYTAGIAYQWGTNGDIPVGQR